MGQRRVLPLSAQRRSGRGDGLLRRDDGATNEIFRITIDGAVPGNRRTRQRMAVISASLAVYLAAGNTITGACVLLLAS